MTKQLTQEPLNIIICGVGGQGNILASELLASALVENDYMITVGETYGASQRGGSVMSHVRISTATEYGVLIPRGEAHILVGFEPIETVRVAREYACKQTWVIFDPRPNYPLGVLIGEESYPTLESIEQELKELCDRVWVLPATDIAIEAGNPQAANITLMGALTALPQLPLNSQDYDRVMEQRFKGSVLELNRKVFKLGADYIAEKI
ncbi:MAG: indolepyruvate oxidoreductase subunit beta [Syntrophomonadaceae bacterium]|nr:indolepyruvate oxidoreductase subunit beta [Syntrophomonadaceae bacterium]